MEQFEYSQVFAVGSPGNGIGGYNLAEPADRVFAFDYNSSGKLDHLVLYRPGLGTLWILKNTAGAFSPVFAAGSPGNGIGGYDLADPADRVFAFDYNSSGKLDHLVLYRPGLGTLWILKNTAGAFSPVFAVGSPGNGIGGYNLADPADRVFAFDYNNSGKLDHLVLYRPGLGTLWILKNIAGAFSPVFAVGSPGNGIGGYDLADPADRVFAFDYNSSGKLDHLVLYRPGLGTLWILKNTAGAFSPVYAEGSPGHGISSYDLGDPRDRVFAFDYNNNGKLDHLVVYRPGSGTLFILKNTGGVFSPVYAEGSPGTGIGDYDLKSDSDRAFAFDYNSTNNLNHLVLYRPGKGTIWILKQQPATLPTVSDFSPGEGAQGDTVVIRGTRLKRTSRVLFNNSSATIINKQSTWVSVTVPRNVRSGQITIETPVGNATTVAPFVVLPPPMISSFTPANGRVGTGITINGRNFRRMTSVLINDVSTNFSTVSDTIMTTTVPGHATDGPIKVVGAGGNATSSNKFHVDILQLPANLAFINTWIIPTEHPPVGPQFIVFFSFFNGGGTATGSFTIRLQLDNGAAYRDVKAPSYSPGSSDSVFWDFPFGLPAGDHFIYAYLDVFNQVAEVSEADNVSYHGFRVG
jgi:hypothetical protein